MPKFFKSRHPDRDFATSANDGDESRNRIVRLVTTLIVSVALSSCGGGGGGDSGSSSQTAANASASNSNTATASSAAAASSASASAASSAAAASSGNAASAASAAGASGVASSTIVSARALPVKPAWTAYYGSAANTTLSKLASTFNMIVIDADPDAGAFSTAQIAQMKSGGMRVLSYLDLGSCENFRTYFTTVPAGFVSCSANTAANLGPYDSGSYGDEDWMNPSNADYQNLLVNYVAPRLVAAGVDGFMLDNFEIVGHTATQKYGPCDATCAQGGLDLVAKLRAKYPTLSIVLNNAPSFARNGSTGGVAFPTLVDGVLSEDAYDNQSDPDTAAQLSSWMSLEQNLGNTSFFVGTLDYEKTCTSASDQAAALLDWTTSKAAGFSPSIETVSLNTVCWWNFLTSLL